MDNVFRDALNNFTHEFASGGEIRHLASLGYSAKEISDRLLFPTPMEKICKEYTQFLIAEGVLSFDGKAHDNIRYEYVLEQDDFGKKSYRKIVKNDKENIKRERQYIRCRFTSSGELKNDFLSYLTPKQILYVKSIQWKTGILYHEKNEVLQGIINRIPENEREKYFIE